MLVESAFSDATLSRTVVSISKAMRLATPSSSAASPIRGMFMDGVLGTRLASTISISLGRPRVTLMFATPAWWKVRMFIWVPGSPMECAAIIPTDSLGSMRRSLYMRSAATNTFSTVSSSRPASSMRPAISIMVFRVSSTPLFSARARTLSSSAV